jgi:hypothetical protein
MPDSFDNRPNPNSLSMRHEYTPPFLQLTPDIKVLRVSDLNFVLNLRDIYHRLYGLWRCAFAWSRTWQESGRLFLHEGKTPPEEVIS